METSELANLSHLLHGDPDRPELVLRVVPLPADLNWNGAIFGGWIMSHLDIAGALLAYRRAKGKVATVAVNSLTFKQPVEVGDLLSFYAQIVKTGNTSLTLDVSVFARRHSDMDSPPVKVTEATLVYVAIDEQGKPRPLPPLPPKPAGQAPQDVA